MATRGLPEPWTQLCRWDGKSHKEIIEDRERGPDRVSELQKRVTDLEQQIERLVTTEKL
jgi:hypothetical protein